MRGAISQFGARNRCGSGARQIHHGPKEISKPSFWLHLSRKLRAQVLRPSRLASLKKADTGRAAPYLEDGRFTPPARCHRESGLT